MSMVFIRPIDLPGKRMRYRSGYGANEPKDILLTGKNLSEEEQRFVVVISTSYPGVLQDAYVNKALIALVHRAITENGLHIACEDIYSPGEDVPEEEVGTLCEEEGYVLLTDEGLRIGALRVWMYSWSSGGPFYGEFDVIMDMVIPRDLLSGLTESLRRLAEAHSVTVDDYGRAADRPEHVQKGSFFKRLLGRRAAPAPR
jgi:hypothetical protein